MTPRAVLRLALIAGALIIMMIGLGFLIAGDSLVGWVMIGVGAFDFVTVPFVVRAIDRGRPRPGPTEPPDFGADPSYNPYARED